MMAKLPTFLLRYLSKVESKKVMEKELAREAAIAS
jgi:hypothetical protein